MRPLSDSQVQITLLGFIFFCGPAMVNAIGGLGAFGLQAKDAPIVNIASTILAAIFAISSLTAGGIFNLLSHRWLLFLGGLGYTFYVASFFVYSHQGSITIVVVSALLLGLLAGWCWCAQGAMMMSYPTEDEKGKYFGIFWSIYNTGGVVGNMIPLASQWNDNVSKSVTDLTFIIFLSIMGFGSLIGLLFLVPVTKVKRKDGTMVGKIQFSNNNNGGGKNGSIRKEFQEIIELFKDWRILFLFPMFFTSNWFYPYQFSLNALNMASIRTRSFNSAYYWGSQVLASLIFGNFLDRPQWKRSTRARYGFIVLTILLTITWTSAIGFQSTIGPRYSVLNPDGISYSMDRSDFLSLDIIDNTGDWFEFFILYILFGISDSIFQAFAYWLLGALTNNVNKAARFSGFYKFGQNLGSIFSGLVSTAVIGNTPTHPEKAVWHGMGEVLICVGLVTISMVCATPVVLLAVKDTTVEEEIVEDFEEQKQETDQGQVKR